MPKQEKFVLCYRTKEDHVYKPLIDGHGKIWAAPLGEGQEKIADSASEMILLDLDPINEKLRKVLRDMKSQKASCEMTVKQYSGTEKGKAYAASYDSIAKSLDIYLKQIEEALPQLKDDFE